MPAGLETCTNLAPFFNVLGFKLKAVSIDEKLGSHIYRITSVLSPFQRVSSRIKYAMLPGFVNPE